MNTVPLASLVPPCFTARRRAISFPKLNGAYAGEPEAGNGLARLFQIVKEATDVDFSGYKPATVNRRIRRRMAATRSESLGEYLRYISEHQEEITGLYQDLLVPVTSFFRDPQAFATLRRIAFPALLKQREPSDTIRVWVPGCSTGEEAYSHAICLVEYVSEIGADAKLRVFGTDVNEAAIQQVRAGIFKANIKADVSPMRLQRFFSQQDGGYKISKSIRDLCIFARHGRISMLLRAQYTAICFM